VAEPHLPRPSRNLLGMKLIAIAISLVTGYTF
jgi:hypothetical protein